MAKLATFWCVQHDGSQLFRDTVPVYLHDHYGYKWEGDVIGAYYGYDGSESFSGTNYYSDPTNFSNPVIIYTLKEFIDIIRLESGPFSWTIDTIKKSELPERWYIRLDDISRPIVGKYFDEQAGVSCYLESKSRNWEYLNSHNNSDEPITRKGGGASYAASNITATKGTQISLKEFIHFVLKKESSVYVPVAKSSKVVNTNEEISKLIINVPII